MTNPSFTVYTLGSYATAGDGSVMNSMLKSIGVCAHVPEYQIDAACGLAGSGPAYVSSTFLGNCEYYLRFNCFN